MHSTKLMCLLVILDLIVDGPIGLLPPGSHERQIDPDPDWEDSCLKKDVECAIPVGLLSSPVAHCTGLL